MNKSVSRPEFCTAEELGRPIPDAADAVSVCLPLWQHNVGYEEADPDVINRMKCGYPRFFLHPLAVKLFAECERQFANADECCLAFPSQRVATRCAEFLARRAGIAGTVHDFGMHRVHAVCLPQAARATAREYWQHTGEIVSSRHAAAALERTPVDTDGERVAKQSLRQRVAEFSGAQPEDVYLFPNGMAAIFCAYRALQKLRPDLKSVQFGFAYVDSLKIQEKFGAGVNFYPNGNAAELTALTGQLDAERILGLFCEFPSNPLLLSPDLRELNRLSAKHDFPLVVDDTLAACINLDLLPACDMLATSLTKFFSGAGDVMGGALVVNSNRPQYRQLKSALDEEFEDLLFAPDAVVLEKNSRDVIERVKQINQNAETLCDWLREQPAVARIDYPKYNTSDNYRAFLRQGGGYGGLFSLQLKNPAENAPRFFDALQICKGPNLGTNFSLCCPYTILAHYRELDFAERCNVSQFLLRISVGLEDVDWLKSRFRQALDSLR